VLLNKSSKQLPVREIMRTDLPKLSKNDPIEKCMEIMTQLNVRYLPVVENETLIGLISVKDLLDEVLLHQKDVIENLTHYINT
jgi:CBS domain-containing protein